MSTQSSTPPGEHTEQPTLFLTVEEVAHELRCTPRHVRNLISRGDLPRVELGRSIRVPRSALVALAEAATTNGGRS